MSEYENENENENDAADDVLSFSLERAERPVKIHVPETDETLTYTLREMTGQSRDAYLNFMAGRMRHDQSGKPSGIKNFDGMQADLIARCLFDPDKKRVDPKTISRWPSKVQQALFEVCQEMNGLDESAEKKAKND